MSLLQSILGPEGVKALPPEKLAALCQEIRDVLIEVTAKNGGHVGPNLGVVELTVALHRVFNTPKDKVIFDVSHQGYVHKLLTGRQGERFSKIRQSGGFSGFLSREESKHDAFGAGHAGTALSAAVGFAVGRDRLGSDEHVVAVIGDASLTCGITLEALNNAASSTQRLVIILNDNEWSIAKNVGAVAKYLNEIITNPAYTQFHRHAEEFLNKVPGGPKLIKLISKAKKEAKDFIVPSSLFEKFNIRYLGPIDGHNLEDLEKYLNFCKNSTGPVLLHVLTKKGKGYDVAINNPEKFHGSGAYDVSTGKSTSNPTVPNYQDVFGEALVHAAQIDKRILGITAAMPSGTGLNKLATALPEQFFDVGIAEEHAVIFAAGLAAQGLKPVCAIYSTFLQRAFDPIMHDVCLQNLPVVFCMDRAGLSPNDGPTHHGLYDISFLRSIPHTVIMQPKDEDELVDMLTTALRCVQPVFIRYPRGAGTGVQIKPKPCILHLGQAEVLRKGEKVAFWALGPMVSEAMKIAQKIEKAVGLKIEVVNARFVKPIDQQLLREQMHRRFQLIVTFEDHVITNGFGSAILEEVHSPIPTIIADGSIEKNPDINFPVTVLRLGWPDQFISHGSSIGDLRKIHGLSESQMQERILEKINELNILKENESIAGRGIQSVSIKTVNTSSS